MADKKPTETFYNLLGGINQKASEYAVGRAQFLDIRNMDFDVPNALQKRPGSTQAVSAGTSGPVNSLFEFVKLTGESYVIAGSDTAMFYLAGSAYTLLDSGWSNGQPTDMLTFVNKLWMANGQNFKWWDGTSVMPAGLPMQNTLNSAEGFLIGNQGVSNFFVGGATALQITSLYSNSYVLRGVYLAYGYQRTDGYIGPIDFLANARNVMLGTPATSGLDYFVQGSTSTDRFIYGFSVPTGYAISGIVLYIATDTISTSSATYFLGQTLGVQKVGNLGWRVNTGGNFLQTSVTLFPGADVSRFHYFTTIASSSLIITNYNGDTSWAAPIQLGASFFDSYAGLAVTDGFSGMSRAWFNTYTPKFIEQNQNVMFYAGFSSSPSTVWFSELGLPENIDPEFSFEVRTNDGDRITGTKSYNNQVIVFKQNSFHKVIGDNPDNFQLVELSQQFGCLSNKTIVEYKENLVWLDSRGVVMFNGAGWELISTPVEDTFRRINISAALENACAVHYKFRNQIWFGIPIDNSTQNNITIVWDYLVNAWTIFEGFNVASMALVKGSLTRPTAWRGDYSGMIYYHGESFYGDNGAGITCLARPHWDKLAENQTWLWRRFFLDVGTVSGLTGQITGKVFSDYDSSTVQATFSMYQSQFQSRAEMGVQAKAVTAEFAHYSASLPLLINGFSWARRNLRNV